ncbi:DUF1801 domain-containing protein [Longimicrobium terrae]|uniref:YdhG-like domain-containing protein n=1 Tax=Longimicrobium terrae TaxID=1639882 RepID=A0A841GVN0_9BACT|nr:DUF1801 domain-containing protein [Longimicrobium terrae]MBB4635434.1 hypothetical protein [Longimicrobium terrae]MBB6069828.1 hypothetical protein [Longimicrobium terrae]NNC30966.1 hypothetical protein [Longimicrobium terrae]NNC32748.1 hypothetical protein [Longimicrobium terrae]
MAETSRDELLANYSPAVRALAEEACDLIRSLMPADAPEKVHPGWKNIIFGHGMVLAVGPLKDRINIMLAGAGLPDPSGLMEGSGKAGRHIKIRSSEALRNPALADLLRAAVADSAVPAPQRAATRAGEPVSGHRAYASKTVNAPVDRLFAAWTDDGERAGWAGDHPITIRGTTPGKSLRARWEAMPLDVRFEAKGEAKSAVTIDHREIGTAEEAARIKGLWKEALDRLKASLEG